jgi:hypothetical protein
LGRGLTKFSRNGVNYHSFQITAELALGGIIPKIGHRSIEVNEDILQHIVGVARL